MDLMSSIGVSASGMAAQSMRIKMHSENVANADSVQNAEGTGPYRRKQIYFTAEVNKATGLTEVKVDKIQDDTRTPLNYVYDPGHQLADANGFVAMPNVDVLTETMDMRNAARSYEANMQAIEVAKDMMVRSIDRLR